MRTTLRRGISRMLHLDDQQRIDGYRALLLQDDVPSAAELSPLESRLARMLITNVADQVLAKERNPAVRSRSLWAHPQARAELATSPRCGATEGGPPASPSQGPSGRCRSTADTRGSRFWRRWARAMASRPHPGAKASTTPKGAGADLLASLSTKPAVSSRQPPDTATTRSRANASTGRASQGHEKRVRLAGDIKTTCRWDARFCCLHALGSTTAPSGSLARPTYVSHEGERPMAVTWQLQTPLPGDLFAAFAAAVA